MSPMTVIRLAAAAVGSLLVLLNAFHLSIGLVRLHRALSTETIAARLIDPLKLGWVMSGCLNLLLGLILLSLLPDLAAGSLVAWKVAMAIGIGLVALGIAAVAVTRGHYGLLTFSIFGLLLLVPLLSWRSLFHS